MLQPAAQSRSGGLRRSPGSIGSNRSPAASRQQPLPPGLPIELDEVLLPLCFSQPLSRVLVVCVDCEDRLVAIDRPRPVGNSLGRLGLPIEFDKVLLSLCFSQPPCGVPVVAINLKDLLIEADRLVPGLRVFSLLRLGIKEGEPLLCARDKLAFVQPSRYCLSISRIFW